MLDYSDRTVQVAIGAIVLVLVFFFVWWVIAIRRKRKARAAAFGNSTTSKQIKRKRKNGKLTQADITAARSALKDDFWQYLIDNAQEDPDDGMMVVHLDVSDRKAFFAEVARHKRDAQTETKVLGSTKKRGKATVQRGS